MILGSGLLTAGTPSFGTLAADSSDSALFSGYTPNVATVGPVSRRLYFGKSGGTWRTLWTDTSGALLRGDEAGTHAVTRASDGPSPFDSDTGLATDVHAGSVSAGTTFTHEADCVIEYQIDTLHSSGVTQMQFRYQNSSNHWIVSVDSAGTLYLYERISGTPTTRGLVGTIVESGDRIVTIVDGTTIKIYTKDTLRITYGSASSLAEYTAGILNAIGTGGVVSDLIAWPRTLSGTAPSILDKAST